MDNSFHILKKDYIKHFTEIFLLKRQFLRMSERDSKHNTVQKEKEMLNCSARH